MNVRQSLKRIALFKWIVVFARTINEGRNFFARLHAFINFYQDFRAYKKLRINSVWTQEVADLYPRIYDKTTSTPLDPVYFYQDSWCAKKIFLERPLTHLDIGSNAHFVGILSQFVPTTMVDIRPLPVRIHSLSFKKGDVCNLPFEGNSISSLSSICVIEHIGLGRYGDPLDQFGSEKAASELSRVLAPGGNLYISVPIDDKNRVYFNAHRAFTRKYVLELFKGLTLIEEKYIYGNILLPTYSSESGFGTGLFHFKKQEN